MTPDGGACILTDPPPRTGDSRTQPGCYQLDDRPSVPFRDLIHRLATLLALPGLLVAPASLEAQAVADTTPARASIDLDLRVGRIVERSEGVAGGRLLLDLGGGLRFGAGAHTLLRRVGDAPDVTGPGRTLSWAYAGPVVEYASPRLPVRGRLLVGVGLSTLYDDAVGTRVGSDVSTVLVPEFVFPLVRLARVELQVGAGYRFVVQSDGPGPIDASDLRSGFFALTFRIGPL